MDVTRPYRPSGPVTRAWSPPPGGVERGPGPDRRRRWLAPLGPAALVAAGLVVAACAASDQDATSSGTAVESEVASPASGRAAATSVATTETTTTTSAATDDVDGETAPDPPTIGSEPEPSPSVPSSTEQVTTAPEPSSTATDPLEAAGPPIVIRLAIDRRVDDGATEGFAAFVRSVLTDERGWTRAGFEFAFDQTDADYTVVLAEGDAVDALCLPYDTFGRFSCQIGPIVALNADRWRVGVDSWPASLDAYRTMLVNHEVGHLLGQHHPATRCPGDGLPAPVMAQQSSGVAPCTANPWPLAWEIDCARRGTEPLAPPYERDITLTCGPEGPVG